MRQKLRVAVLIAIIVGLAIPALAETEAEAEMTAPIVKRGTQIDPYYPATAMNKTPAAVALRATVQANGKVGALEVVDCDNPNLGFEQAAMDAVKYWRFKPGRVNGEAVAMETYLLLEFQAPLSGSAREQSTLARTLVAPAFQLATPAVRGPAPTSGRTSAGNSTAAVTTSGPISISRLFPKRRGQDLIDKSNFNPVQRQVVGLPGGGGRRGGGASAQGRSSR